MSQAQSTDTGPSKLKDDVIRTFLIIAAHAEALPDGKFTAIAAANWLIEERQKMSQKKVRGAFDQLVAASMLKRADPRNQISEEYEVTENGGVLP
jgi:hypothetical protein